MKAHTYHQYNKWKSFYKGEIPIEDMYILAQVYVNMIHKFIGVNLGKDVYSMSDEEVFKIVGENIQPPD